jgi:methionyl-tRNA formyltransferase
MRIAFFAPEEPTQLPAFFSRVLSSLPDDDVTMVVVRPVYRGSSLRKEAQKFIRAFGWWEFLVEGSTVAAEIGADIVNKTTGIGHPHSVKGVARDFNVLLLEPDDINAPEHLAQIGSLALDLIVSISCPQIFRRELLDIPSIGCVNLHSGLLPNYRGVLPTFWALANGEHETGVTLYFMGEGIDDGAIIAQQHVTISQTETLRSLIRRCKQAGAELVLETVERLREGPVAVSENRLAEGSYFSFPGRSDVIRFKAQGWALR